AGVDVSYKGLLVSPLSFATDFKRTMPLDENSRELRMTSCRIIRPTRV
ncbi:hypothetical protein EJB05_55384, partial [Eragrostis curvula]